MDKKSREEKFKAMKLPELKFYLQNRGITVNSYLKPGLVAIACAVEEMNLPVLCQTSEADEKLSISRRLNLHDVQLPDPFKMDVLNDFKHSPPFGLFDIFNHLIYHSSEYDKQGLAAYKSYENYRLFYDGYVESLLTIHRKDAGVHVYVGKVKPTMKDKTKDGKEFYDLWFVLEGKGSNRGSVLDAYCACLGGRDGGCKHVAAALYSLDDLLNTKGEDSTTSKPCQWIRRPKPDTTPCELKDLPVRKRGLKDHEETKRKRSREYTFSQYIEHDPRPLSDRTPCTQERVATLVTSMEKMKEKPAILPILKQKLIGSDKGKDGNTTGMKVAPEKHGIMEKKLIQHIESNNQANADSFLGSLEFSEEEIDNVASLTKKQWQCKEWYVHKRGFITASKAKNVYTRQISAERQPETDVSVLVKSLTQQKDVSARQNITEDPKNPLDWGLKHEESARKAYYRLESSKHNQLSLISKGLMISKTRPFIGASPDNITSCKCTPLCERILVEYKCPWSHKDLDPKEAFLQPEIGGMWQNDTFFLQEKSRYFYQIQLLMHVTELKKCDLVVWTQKGIFCHRIMYAPLFFEKICIKLKRFWLTSVVPHMLESFCSYSKSSGKSLVIQYNF